MGRRRKKRSKNSFKAPVENQSINTAHLLPLQTALLQSQSSQPSSVLTTLPLEDTAARQVKHVQSSDISFSPPFCVIEDYLNISTPTTSSPQPKEPFGLLPTKWSLWSALTSITSYVPSW